MFHYYRKLANLTGDEGEQNKTHKGDEGNNTEKGNGNNCSNRVYNVFVSLCVWYVFVMIGHLLLQVNEYVCESASRLWSRWLKFIISFCAGLFNPSIKVKFQSRSQGVPEENVHSCQFTLVFWSSVWTVGSLQVLQEIVFLPRGLKRNLLRGTSSKLRCQVSPHTWEPLAFRQRPVWMMVSFSRKRVGILTDV